MKKFLLPLLLVLTSMPLSAQEFSFQDIKYRVTSKKDKTCEVCGCDKNLSGNVIIPSKVKGYTVTSIGNSACLCSALTSIVIPDSVKSIGNSAFSHCRALTSVVIPESVKSIEAYAFFSCSSLTSVVIPKSVKSIEAHAFFSCSSLTSVVIPKSVKSIGAYAFQSCESLTSVVIPNSVKSIGYAAFNCCKSLTSVVIPSSVTSIGNVSFSGCTSLTSVVIPDSVTSIEASAFSSCSSLTSVVIPESVKSIGNSAFSHCRALTSVVIPDSVKSIEEDAFKGCSSLTSIVISKSVTSIGKSAFSGCDGLVILSNPYITFTGDPFDGFRGKLLYPKGLSAQTAYANKEEIDGNNLEQIFLANALMDPFIKTYVENRVNGWQEKGEFEKTSDWQARVTRENREAKAREYLSEAVNVYLNDNKFNLGDYDADSETYLVEGNKLGKAFFKVPMSDAKSFKEKWASFTKTPEYSINGNNIALLSLTVSTDKGPSYRYTNQDKVEYATTKTEFNFAPIDLGLASVGTGAASPAGQNIGSRTASVGGGNSAVSDVDVNIPRGNRTADRTFAVIIANEQYQYASTVDYAINDGIVFSKYCNLTLGIPEKNILLYKNATFGNMRKALIRIKEISEALGGDLDVIFYYAGHGLPDEKTRDAYLLPVDSEGSMLETCIKTSSLYNSLKSTGARRVTVLMDACFSGSERGEGMLASARGVRLNVKMDEVPGRMVVLTAAQGDETAYPYKEKSHGLFTYYLLKKLQETSGKVSLGELADYLTSEVNKESVISNGRKQTPSASPSTEASDWRQWRL